MRDEDLRAEHFRQAEASFLLEGLDASRNEHYQAIKARVIAGEIDAEEGIRQTAEYYRALSRSSIPEFAVTE